MLNSQFLESSQKEIIISIPNPNVFQYNLEIIVTKNVNPAVFQSPSIYWRVLKNCEYFSDVQMTKNLLENYQQNFSKCDDFNFQNCNVEKLETILKKFSHKKQEICIPWIKNSACRTDDWKILQSIAHDYISPGSLEKANLVLEQFSNVPNLFDTCIRASEILKILNAKEREFSYQLEDKEEELNAKEKSFDHQLESKKEEMNCVSEEFENYKEEVKNLVIKAAEESESYLENDVMKFLERHADIDENMKSNLKKMLNNAQFCHTDIFKHSKGYSGHGYWKCCAERNRNAIGCCLRDFRRGRY